ncbi:MAG: protein kinase family protein [Waddliaceae bacterium]|nr:protein kinase family protein [Waddliaceae bacterium]
MTSNNKIGSGQPGNFRRPLGPIKKRKDKSVVRRSSEAGLTALSSSSQKSPSITKMTKKALPTIKGSPRSAQSSEASSPEDGKAKVLSSIVLSNKESQKIALAQAYDKMDASLQNLEETDKKLASFNFLKISPSVTALEGSLSSLSSEELDDLDRVLDGSLKDIDLFNQFLAEANRHQDEISQLKAALTRAPSPTSSGDDLEKFSKVQQKNIALERSIQSRKESVRKEKEKWEPFHEGFSEEKKQYVKDRGVSQVTIDKAVKVASEMFLGRRTEPMRILDSSGRDAIILPGEGCSLPKIYFKIKKLGQGGYGKVYMVVNASKRTFSAFKEAMTTGPHARRSIESLFNEARVLRDIGEFPGIQRPPHRVVVIKSDGSAKTGVVGLMSTSHECTVLEKPPKTYEEKKHTSCRLLSALRHIHSSKRPDGITKPAYRHGDIKPDNIFVPYRKKYDPILGDFGDAHSFDKLEKKFIAAQESIKGYKGSPPPSIVKKLALGLWGTHTDAFCSFYNDSSGDKTFRDVEAIQEALKDGNFEEYKAIEKARDVYALGMSFILSFAFKGGFRTLIEKRILERVITNINSSKVLPDYIKELLEKRGFSRPQREVLERMVSSSWNKRPLVKYAQKAFKQ